eukprot:3835352-Amphidinium_carterae.1
MQQGNWPEAGARSRVLAVLMQANNISLSPRSRYSSFSHAAREKQGNPMKKAIRHVLEHLNCKHVPPRTFATMHTCESDAWSALVVEVLAECPSTIPRGAEAVLARGGN